MSIYYDRRYSIFLDNDLFIEGGADRQFKVVFNVRTEFGGSIAYGDIAIYNLSQTTINEIKAGQVIKVHAGYVDNVDLIFSGIIRNVFRERVGPDVITRVIAFSGGEAADRIEQPYTLPVNSTLLDAIEAYASEMGVPMVITGDDFKDAPLLLRGKDIQGVPYRELQRLAIAHKFEMVIESSKLIVIAQGKARAGPKHLVSEPTGMSSIPEVTEVGCDVSVRINPKIKIGHIMTVKSELRTFNFSGIYFRNIDGHDGNGDYVVKKIEYTGDSWGDSWDTKLTGWKI